MAKQFCEVPIEPIIKILIVTTTVAMSGTWAKNAAKNINIPITVPEGYTAIGLQGWDYSITTTGATGYQDWICLLRYGITNTNIGLRYKNDAANDITNLSTFNISNLKVVCVKSDNIES